MAAPGSSASGGPATGMVERRRRALSQGAHEDTKFTRAGEENVVGVDLVVFPLRVFRAFVRALLAPTQSAGRRSMEIGRCC
jgi:hypothetical protein